MKFQSGKLSKSKLLLLYKLLLKPRLIEEKMLILLRQGKISKWFSGIGQEAISIGATLAMKNNEYILPMHRNLGVFTTRGIPLEKLFAQFQGKITGFTKGRDRSFHFGSKEYHIVGMISHLAAQMPIANGIALANKLRNESKATLVFTGEGGTSEGDFHEAVNVAAVWDLPVIFLIENNGYGLSTPVSQQFKFDSFTHKGPAYGIQAKKINGNNVLEVYREIQKTVRKIRKDPQPVIIEAVTFRMRGHEEASGTKYIPKELMDQWAAKDPVDNYEKWLLKEKVITRKNIDDLKNTIRNEIDLGLKKASGEPLPETSVNEEIKDVFSPNTPAPVLPNTNSKSKKRFVDAISEGLRQSLEKFPELVFMGQDVAEYGGVFKISEGFLDRFGKDRIRNTPICESAILGMGLGLSVEGFKSVIEMQFADFVSCGFNQIVNNLAKSHYRWGQNADVVIRMPTGAGVGAGPYHSQSNEAWFFHTPGLKIVYPSTPYYAKGLLIAAIADPNPVLYFEHKMLYRSVEEEIPDDHYTLELGKGRMVTMGTDLSIITYGAGVKWALECISGLKEVSIEIVDLVSLMPWDKDLVKQTVEKTNKVIVFHEDTVTGGIGSEIAAWISENCFEYLDAPVMREGSLDTPVPFSTPLEENFLPKRRLMDKITEVLDF